MDMQSSSAYGVVSEESQALRKGVSFFFSFTLEMGGESIEKGRRTEEEEKQREKRGGRGRSLGLLHTGPSEERFSAPAAVQHPGKLEATLTAGFYPGDADGLIGLGCGLGISISISIRRF